MSDDLIGELTRADQIRELLFEHLPNHRTEDGRRLDNKKVREDLDMTRQAYGNWFTRGRISYLKMTDLTKLEGSTLTLDVLLPFTDAARP